MGIHGPGVDGSGIGPDLFKDLQSTDDPVPVLYQKTEKIVFDAGKVHCVPTLSRFVLVEVDLDVAEGARLHPVRLVRPSSEKGLHPRKELSAAEGLRNVVVCAQLEAEDLVDLLALGREDEDGGRNTGLT